MSYSHSLNITEFSSTLTLKGTTWRRLSPDIACPTGIAKRQGHTHSIWNIFVINYRRYHVPICPLLGSIGIFVGGCGCLRGVRGAKSVTGRPPTRPDETRKSPTITYGPSSKASVVPSDDIGIY